MAEQTLQERLRVIQPSGNLPRDHITLAEAAGRIDALEAERDAFRERASQLECALREYLYESTHLATPQTVGGREYRNALIPWSEIKLARTALAQLDSGEKTNGN